MTNLLLFLVLLGALLLGARLVFRPPRHHRRSTSEAVRASRATRLGRIALSPPPTSDARNSGVLPLLDGSEAFAARIALVRAAEMALDVQYYIWRRDATGLTLLDELRRAAERGVRVRLLLDDNGIAGLDGELAALDALPNAEVRLFNPFILRRLKLVGYAFDFFRLNRRMHNKSLTADGAMSILGGRNIGDDYFAFGEGIQFIDTDVLVTGRVAADIGADFDRYWASHSAHAAERILSRPRAWARVLRLLNAEAAAAASSPEGRTYGERLQQTTIGNGILSGELPFEWTGVTLISDDPAKGLGKAEVKHLLLPQLMKLMARPGHSVDLVSAYFVPGRRIARALAELARNGARVRILTNSQNATDVFFVHSAYVKYRGALLRAGAKLYELKPAFAAEDDSEHLHLRGISRASLHSKTVAIDEQRIFIGSFNFDPRSFALNTEMGVLIESANLAEGLAQAFDRVFPVTSYCPLRQENGRLVWTETTPAGDVIRHDREPGTSLQSRLLLSLVGLLPIEWLL